MTLIETAMSWAIGWLLLAGPSSSSPLLQETRAPSVRRPADLAAFDPGLAKVREQLLRAYHYRDFDLLMPALASRMSFDFESHSPEEFVALARKWPADQVAEFWRKVHDALALGMARAEDPDYVLAPYVATLPINLFQNDTDLAIAGERVAVRSAASPTAPIVDRLSYLIVEGTGAIVPASAQSVTVDGMGYGWRQIITPRGQTGWVVDKYARSPYGFRLVFQRINGVWKLTGIAEGD